MTKYIIQSKKEKSFVKKKSWVEKNTTMCLVSWKSVEKLYCRVPGQVDKIVPKNEQEKERKFVDKTS